MLYHEAFLSINNLMEYLDTYALDHICAESTLYLGESDLKSFINQPIANHYTQEKEPALLKNVAFDIKEYRQKYYALYQKLSDVESQNTLFGLMKFRLAPLPTFLSDIYSFKMAYLDNSILHFEKEGAVIDYGEYAETYINYLQPLYPNYNKLFIYSRDKETCTACSKLTEIPNLKVVYGGLGSKTLRLKLPNPINPKQMVDFATDSIDDAIKEPISFLRINAKGQEADVLLGAKQHIKNEAPAIAICVGNTISDLWKIPELLTSIYPDYHFYMRHYSILSICDTILYAVTK